LTVNGLEAAFEGDLVVFFKVDVFVPLLVVLETDEVLVTDIFGVLKELESVGVLVLVIDDTLDTELGVLVFLEVNEPERVGVLVLIDP
jgi:hypothetical protein